MSTDDALAFCRRRLETAIARSGDLSHAAAMLRDDDDEAERTWTDARALEVRGRDLTPHRLAAERQRIALLGAIEAGRQLLASLAEAVRAETVVLRAVAAARVAIQSAAVATAAARREVDTAVMSSQAAERECAAAKAMLGRL